MAAHPPTTAPRPPLPWLALGLSTGVLHFAALFLHSPGIGLVSKPWPVVALAVWVYGARPDRVGRLLSGGLLAGALGDVLLDLPGAFLTGVGAFALGHLLYILALMAEPAGRRVEALRQLPYALWVGGLLAWAVPRVGGLGVPFLAYGLILGAMMGRAAARVRRPPGPGELLALAGATVFGLSDSLIALGRAGLQIPAADLLIMATYWAGQTMLALGMVRGGERRGQDRPPATRREASG